ncbi:thioredoxin domain-containing protein [Sphingomonas jatrophae]|uniref:Protein-disulfide isomerase n=1 Tax=Sphingomonas jatrophae TaxID=1166337 RepID=A0A1I6KYW3_9SPHN|nr:thioredoxin domain-containing protein [Sphingomonas jatrophae]SFR96110.1 Protein-disulfide isomerase [Sphingomonas jatrophae]
MRSAALLTLLATAALVSACGDKGGESGTGATAPTAAAVKAPAGKDWTEVVNVSPTGGFVMGNPDAPVKLVEYASFTCPHCAEFEEKGVPTLRDTYIKSGRVSWEFRSFLLNGIDAPVSILARCQGPEPFFKIAEQLYATQNDWVGNFQKLTEADQARLQSLPPQQQMVELVKLGKLDAFFRQRGLPEAKINQCLADKGQLDTLQKIMSAGQADNITGTPSFVMNGALLDNVFSWEALEPKLKAAVGD